MNRIYYLDTSFLINGWRKRYRRSVFPGVWDRLDQLAHDNRLFSCREVFEELQKKDDDLFDWAKRRRNMFVEPNDESLEVFRKVMRRYPNFAAKAGTTNAADPWIVAEAWYGQGAVITDEEPGPKLKSTKPPKIPDACDTLKVRWLSPIAFLEEIELKLELPIDDDR